MLTNHSDPAVRFYNRARWIQWASDLVSAARFQSAVSWYRITH